MHRESELRTRGEVRGDVSDAELRRSVTDADFVSFFPLSLLLLFLFGRFFSLLLSISPSLLLDKEDAVECE